MNTPQPNNMRLRLVEKKWSDECDYEIAHTEQPNKQAGLAIEIMRHLAICAATPDGEDSAGRQTLRLLAPEDVAERACQIADAAWEKFRKREWLLTMPELPPKSTTPKEGAI